MKRTVLVSLATALLAISSALADEPKEAPAKDQKAKVLTERPAAPVDSPLVRAAKAARKSREKTAASQKVITDASVKKSTGRLTVLSDKNPAGLPPAEEAEAILKKAEKDRADAALEAAKASREAEALEKEIARLDRELASIEEEYYDESDVELREDVSQRDFGKTKADLAAAREKLAAVKKRQEQYARLASQVVKP